MTADLDWKQLGTAIRARRVNLRLSQPKLAEKAQVSLSTVNLMENGKRDSYHAVTMGAVESALEWPQGTIEHILTRASRDEIDNLVVLTSAEHADLAGPTENVGPSHEGDDQDEDTILLSLPPGLTPRQREQARIAGEAAARAVADALRGNDDGVQP